MFAHMRATNKIVTCHTYHKKGLLNISSKGTIMFACWKGIFGNLGGRLRKGCNFRFAFVSSLPWKLSVRRSFSTYSLRFTSPYFAHRQVCGFPDRGRPGMAIVEHLTSTERGRSSAASQQSHELPSTPPSQSATGDDNSRFAELDGVIVHHKLFPLSGDAVDGPVAVCLHGFGASLFSFEVCEPLQQHVSVLAYDAPGFGLTSRPTRLQFYSPDFSARISRSLALAYTNSRYVLIAHSMGAIAAAYATVTNPHEILAAILIAPALLPASNGPPCLASASRLVANSFVTLSAALTTFLSPILVPVLRTCVTPKGFWRSALTHARAGHSQLPDEILEGYRRPIVAPDWERGILNFTRASLKERARSLRQDKDYIAMISSIGFSAPPILIVHGAQDKLVPLDNSVRLATELPTASLVIMDNCGHIPHEEDPQQFSDIVANFLQSNANRD